MLMLNRYAIETTSEYIDKCLESLKLKGATIASVSVSNDKFLILYKGGTRYTLNELLGVDENGHY